ncbi:MAG TPA: helix-turn-helix transcriptional regulator [Planctomycetaceae bacterium]|nr:helix-turn-helix transcriptional regulator [Planctomycetaceae bacterium]
MTAKRSNPAYLNGVPELLVLQLLARQPMHGYEIVQAIRIGTSDVFEFGEGCIYPILHRLEEAGFLHADRVTVGGRARVVYETTKAGRRQLAKSAAQWEQVVGAVRQILQGSANGQPRLA